MEIYEKTYFEEFFNEFGKKAEDQNYKFKSLKRIEFNDDKIKNNIRRAKLRYNLNKVFGFHLWSKINIINYKEIRNLLSNESKDNQNNIMQKFIDDTNTNTNLKILLIDLEYNSPYQKIFYDFCKNFLDNNQNINMIIFHKIGNNNYEENFDKKNISKIIIPNLIDIYYERDINEKNSVNQIYEFNKEFFDLKKLFMVYEGFNDNNNLIYLNISSNSISEEEINRIFLDEQKLCSLNLKRENIQIKYNRQKNHLIIKNNKKEKNLKNSKSICFFSNIIRGLNNLQKLTINGFDFSFYDLINNNISVLSINSLDEFASKNFKHINKDNPKDFENDWKDFNSFEYLQLFQQMKYLIISENVKFLEDILQYIKKNTIKKIKLYTSEIISKNRWNNIKNKIKMKNISLEIVRNNIKNIKYENEEIIDIEEEKYYKIGKNLIYNTNKKFIKNKNWFFSFHSKILQNLGIDYIQRLLDLFSKIYHKLDIQPYHFHLLKRYQISNGKLMDKNEACTIIKPYEKINNLLIIIDPLNKSRKYIGIFKVNYFNNSQGFIICDEGKENFSYEKILNLKISVGEKYIAIYYNNVYSTEKNWEYKCIEVFEIKNS